MGWNRRRFDHEVPSSIKHYKHTAAKESLQANPVLAIYEDKQQRIWIGTWGGGGLTIQDNGLGMDMALCKDRLFTLYRRFHLHIEGKGMELYLVKTQMVAMGGKIDVDSKPDEGTSFYLSFKHVHDVAADNDGFPL